MGRGVFRAAAVLAAVICASSDARADWLITPFAGGTFAAATTYVDLEASADTRQFVLGLSGAWLTRNRILGAEADFSYISHFFESDNRSGLVLGSNVTTFTGSLIAAVPLALTRESLRPYLVGGAGMIHAALDDVGSVFDVNDTRTAVSFGGGAIGFVDRAQRMGFRFDLRQFRTLSRSEDLSGETRSRLRFWRATVGVTLRY